MFTAGSTITTAVPTGCIRPKRPKTSSRRCGGSFEEHNRRFTSCLTEAEKEQLSSLLQKIYDSYQAD
ncbi:hypothetical protein HMSSN036_96040 [Paenibacillus macerans]|nr:hypothetical protein HMSSN036_96040 [Paenibacillus macerans]